MTDPIEALLRETLARAGTVQAEMAALRLQLQHQAQRWDDERSMVSRRLEGLEKAAQETRELHIRWTPHVDRVAGATDATLSTLGRYALIAAIVVAALLGGGALLPRLLAPVVTGAAAVGGP